MTYKSPLHIVKNLSDDESFEINQANLVRLRKKLLADLNLSGDITLNVNGKSYSKDEIIKTIDQLLDAPDLLLHEFIYNHSFLLRYLEDETLSLNPAAYKELVIPEDLQEKLNHLLYERIQLDLKKNISSRKFTPAKLTLRIIPFLPEQYQELLYEDLNASLTTLHSFLYEIEHSISLSHKKEIQFLSYASWAEFLNDLPDEFEYLKYDLINRTINIVVGYHKLSRHDSDLVKGISTVLTKMVCVDEQAVLIKSNHKVFTAGETSDYGFLKYIGVAIIILVNVLRGCSKDSPNFESTSVRYYNNASDIRNLLHEKENLKNPVNELNAFRVEVYNRTTINSLSHGIEYTPVTPRNGTDPFYKGFKQSVDSVEKSLTETINLINETGFDLIVFCYDSAQTSIYSKYINNAESADFRFNKQSRFVFYFGHKLQRPPHIESRSAFPKISHEFFYVTSPATVEILNIPYRISLKTKKSKSKKTPMVTFTTEFLNEIKDRISFRDLDLIRAYD